MNDAGLHAGSCACGSVHAVHAAAMHFAMDDAGPNGAVPVLAMDAAGADHRMAHREAAAGNEAPWRWP